MLQLLSELKGDIVGVKNMWQIVLVGVMIDSNLYITGINFSKLHNISQYAIM